MTNIEAKTEEMANLDREILGNPSLNLFEREEFSKDDSNEEDYPKTKKEQRNALNAYSQKYRGFKTYKAFRASFCIQKRGFSWEELRRNVKKQRYLSKIVYATDQEGNRVVYSSGGIRN